MLFKAKCTSGISQYYPILACICHALLLASKLCTEIPQFALLWVGNESVDRGVLCRLLGTQQEVAILLPPSSTTELCWKSVAFRFAGESVFVSACAISALAVIQLSRDLFV